MSGLAYKLSQMQEKLDQRVIAEKKLTGANLEERYLAFFVELGEMVNEWRRFKFWSESPFPKSDVSLLGEYVDGLHFVLSIGNLLEVDYTLVYTPHKEHVTGEEAQYTAIMHQISRIIYAVGEYMIASELPSVTWETVISAYLNLGVLLGFTLEQIEQGYVLKNKVNHIRQDTGY